MSQPNGHRIPFALAGLALIVYGAYLLLFIASPAERRWLGWLILALGVLLAAPPFYLAVRDR